MINSVITGQNDKKVLVFYKKVEVINLDIPEISNKVVVLSDRRCSSNLYIEETSKELKSRRYDCEQVKFVDFGNKNPQPSLFAKRLIDSGSCNLEMFKENITK